MKNRLLLLITILILGFGMAAQVHPQDISVFRVFRKKVKVEKCLREVEQKSLIQVIEAAMQQSLEPEFVRDNYIQTFGCAYEGANVEQNSIQAVHRAIIQSLRNRQVTIRDNMMAVLQAEPPLPENPQRNYSIYVSLPGESENSSCRYDIRIQELEKVSTSESPNAVWAKVITRFAYRDCFERAPVPTPNGSDFVDVMRRAQDVLSAIDQGRFASAQEDVFVKGDTIYEPANIDDLIFGDTITLFDEIDPQKEYPGIFLGRGIFACDTPKDGMLILKFGEERLYGLQVDAGKFRRTMPVFAENQYRAPEVLLQCLFVKYTSKKPGLLPPLTK